MYLDWTYIVLVLPAVGFSLLGQQPGKRRLCPLPGPFPRLRAHRRRGGRGDAAAGGGIWCPD